MDSCWWVRKGSSSPGLLSSPPLLRGPVTKSQYLLRSMLTALALARTRTHLPLGTCGTALGPTAQPRRCILAPPLPCTLPPCSPFSSPARTQLEPGPFSLQGSMAASPSGTGNPGTIPICYLWHYLAHHSEAQAASAGSLGPLHGTPGALARFALLFSSRMYNFSLSSPYLSSKA